MTQGRIYLVVIDEHVNNSYLSSGESKAKHSSGLHGTISTPESALIANVNGSYRSIVNRVTTSGQIHANASPVDQKMLVSSIT